MSIRVLNRGGAGGKKPVLAEKNITENGTYYASDDNVTGYNRVNVNVSDSSPSLLDGTVSRYIDTRGNVTSLRRYAFYSCRSLIEVNFPECSNIDFSAFQNCYSLQAISFPKCNYISSNAFASCSNLQNVSFPECLSTGEDVFANCANLRNASFPKCTFINHEMFSNCQIRYSFL